MCFNKYKNVFYHATYLFLNDYQDMSNLTLKKNLCLLILYY